MDNTDSLSVVVNDDGSLDISWNPNDPKYSWLNDLTDEEMKSIFIQAIEEGLKNYGN